MDSLSELAEIETVTELARVLRELRRREARRRAGTELSYRQLATRAGCSHAIIGAYLTGKTLPPTGRFDILVRLLGASPAEQGALATARDRVEERRRGQPAGVASVASAWDGLGYAYYRLGDHRTALTCLRRALSLFRQVGDGRHAAQVLARIQAVRAKRRPTVLNAGR